MVRVPLLWIGGVFGAVALCLALWLCLTAAHCRKKGDAGSEELMREIPCAFVRVASLVGWLLVLVLLVLLAACTSPCETFGPGDSRL